MDLLAASALPSEWKELRDAVWPNWLHFEEIDSTNNVGKQVLKTAPQRTVILAETQTAGRGRLGRTWFSPPGAGLWFSATLPVDEVSRNALPVLAGYAIWKTFAKMGIFIQLKWPNDLWLKGKKAGGILCEMISQTPGWAVLGIGINFYQRHFPPDLVDIATSIELATQKTLKRNHFLQTFLPILAEDLEHAQATLIEMEQKWPQISAFYHRSIRLMRQQNVEFFTEKGLTSQGKLLVEKNSHIEEISSGEIIIDY